MTTRASFGCRNLSAVIDSDSDGSNSSKLSGFIQQAESRSAPVRRAHERDLLALLTLLAFAASSSRVIASAAAAAAAAAASDGDISAVVHAHLRRLRDHLVLFAHHVLLPTLQPAVADGEIRVWREIGVVRIGCHGCSTPDSTLRVG
jgi:hypothetical protein